MTVALTCTNRDLVGEWPVTFESGEPSMEGGASLRIRFLQKPTRTVRPPLRRGLQWRPAVYDRGVHGPDRTERRHAVPVRLDRRGYGAPVEIAQFQGQWLQLADIVNPDRSRARKCTLWLY